MLALRSSNKLRAHTSVRSDGTSLRQTRAEPTSVEHYDHSRSPSGRSVGTPVDSVPPRNLDVSTPARNSSPRGAYRTSSFPPKSAKQQGDHHADKSARRITRILIVIIVFTSHSRSSLQPGPLGGWNRENKIHHEKQ